MLDKQQHSSPDKHVGEKRGLESAVKHEKVYQRIATQFVKNDGKVKSTKCQTLTNS